MRRRTSLGLIAGTLLAALVVGTASAAPPTKETFDLDDPGAEAFWSEVLTEECGFDVIADFEGTVTVHTFDRATGRGKIQIDKYWIRDTFTRVSTGKTITLNDVGPDLWSYSPEGVLMIALTGRSLTGSGVIGRVVINTETGDVEHMAGKPVGSLAEQVCPMLSD
jgi:hypothetical protein